MSIRLLLTLVCVIGVAEASAQGSGKPRAVPQGRGDSVPQTAADPTAMLLRAELARLGTLVRDRVRSLEVTPDTVRLKRGGKLSIASLRVTARDAKGEIVPGVAPRWALARSQAATFRGDSVVALRPGIAVLNVEPVGRPEGGQAADWPSARVIIVVENTRPRS